MNVIQQMPIYINPQNYSMNSRPNVKRYAVSFNGAAKLSSKDIAMLALTSLALSALISIRNAYVKVFYNSKEDRLRFSASALESFENQEKYQHGENEIKFIQKNLDKYAVNQQQADFVREGLEFIKNNQEDLYNCHTFGQGWGMSSDNKFIIRAMELAMYSACNAGKCNNEEVNTCIKEARELMRKVSDKKQ